VADYDVGSIALVVPSSSAPRATYRPAVSVRNNGIHDALASGYLRIYFADLLVFETELYSATIQPGNTGTAQAVDYWTPTAEGPYTIHAYLSTPLDQVESNNMLQPVTIEITGATPPVPPVVTAHAAQHEEGGTDEVSIDGLQGRTADPQSPLDHAAQHQAGGADALNVGSLQGVLAQDQPAQAHGNTRHNPAMATAELLSLHQGAAVVHSAATNLANRDLSGPRAGLVTELQLVTGTEVPDTSDNPLKAGIRADGFYGPVNAVHHAAKHAPGGLDPISFPPSGTPILEQTTQMIVIDSQSPETVVARLDVPQAYKSESLGLVMKTSARFNIQPSSGASLLMTLKVGDDPAAYTSIPSEMPGEMTADIEAYFHDIGDLFGKAHLRILVSDATGAAKSYIDSSPGDYSYDLNPLAFTLTATPVNLSPYSLIVFDGSLSFCTGSPSA
jgi:hypothetical protein